MQGAAWFPKWHRANVKGTILQQWVDALSNVWCQSCIHTMRAKPASASIWQLSTQWTWPTSRARLSIGSWIVYASYSLHSWRLRICCQLVCALHVQPGTISYGGCSSSVALPCGHQVYGYHLQKICGDRNQSAVGHCSWRSDRHSVSGWAVLLAVSMVDWVSKRQPVTVISSTESESYQ